MYGAGSVGLMGLVADSALAAGGRVVGVIPEALATQELLHPRLSETHVVSDMHARKATMARLADAFIALPGGYGTLEELFEVVTWAQLGFHAKPIGLVNSESFFSPLLSALDQIQDEGFLRAEHRALLYVAPTARELLDSLQASSSQ